MRYNDKGISTKLYKNLLFKAKGDSDFYLDIPKPICDIEFAFLSDFIYGVNIGISKLIFIPSNNITKYCPLNKTYDKLTVEDYRTVKIDLADVAYKIKVANAKFYDSEFTKIVHPYGSYEMDKIFLRTIFGKPHSYGIASQAFGNCKVFNIDEFYRLKLWSQNRSNNLDIPREEFIDRIQSLNTLNKKLEG